MKILLVEPDFPLPTKRKTGAHVPIGLLKIAAYHRALGDDVALVRTPQPAPFKPHEIKITSLFTYWFRDVWDAVDCYKSMYPRARIEVGGIYASLLPKHCIQSGCDEVATGLYRGGVAERFVPAYDLVDSDVQIVHASRGCIRRCSFCGVWRVEPKIRYRKSVSDLIVKPKVLFYDNNLLANPHIQRILEELAEFRLPTGRRIICECQCGFDTRLLTPELAERLKHARFQKLRLSWDGPYADWKQVKEAVALLEEVGYRRGDLYVFMLYNHEIPYVEMKTKLEACRRWGIRVADCRYRPLDQTNDDYRPGKKPQSDDDYFIHSAWTDSQNRRFRRAVRRQNIAVMLGLPNNRYVPGCEQRLVGVPKRVNAKSQF